MRKTSFFIWARCVFNDTKLTFLNVGISTNKDGFIDILSRSGIYKIKSLRSIAFYHILHSSIYATQMSFFQRRANILFQQHALPLHLNILC